MYFYYKNNLLISLNIEDGELLYSYNINKKFPTFFKLNKKVF